MKDDKAAAAAAAPKIIASVEDAMASADKVDNENAARPEPAGAERSLHRTRAFQNLEQEDEVSVPEGQ